jgi:hypothetical protein
MDCAELPTDRGSLAAIPLAIGSNPKARYEILRGLCGACRPAALPLNRF